MSIRPSFDNERRLAVAATELCKHEIAEEERWKVNLTAVVGTALTMLAGLVISLRISFALLVGIIAWAIIMSAVFSIGRLPALFGFGRVSGMFEHDHHRFVEGGLTRMAKTLYFPPRTGRR